MKLSLSSFSYSRWPIEHAIRQTAELGYDAIEIDANRPHMLPEDYPSEERRGIVSLINSTGVKVAAVAAFNGTAQWHFTNPNKRVRLSTIDHVKQCVDLASDLKAPIVEVVSGSPLIEGVGEKEAWHWLHGGLQECAEYAKSSGIIIGLEPEPDNVISNSRLADAIIREVGSSNLRFLLDIGHLNVVKENISQAVRKMKDNLAHVHIHDNDSTRDQHRIPGDGKIDFVSIINALRDIGYSGYLTVELEQGLIGDAPAIRAKRYLERILS
ncbi:MAG: sugar phosphate isomerase/epimerase family protein [Candidatus Bathyarchaeia archaeon]